MHHSFPILVSSHASFRLSLLRIFFTTLTFFTGLTVAFCQSHPVSDSLTKSSKLISPKPFRITTLTYGGTGILFTRVNNQFTVLNGGRGSATFNNRFTFGGGGWGMSRGVEIQSGNRDTFQFVKMGYGGLEFGYILYPGKRLSIGSNVLVAGGAAFRESLPKARGTMNFFPVLEPSLYCQLGLGKLFRLDAGVTYRYVPGPHLSYMPGRSLSGFSCYVALLAGTCRCD